MSQPEIAYRQNRLFPDQDNRGPFEKLLEKECSATGYRMLRRFARRLDYLTGLQHRNDQIRKLWHKLRNDGMTKDEAVDFLTEEFNTGRDNIDQIIYPRLQRKH
jgi:hypothetical protein